MSSVKTFDIGGEQYNVARASAVAQDEVLSLLTQSLVSRLVAAGQDGTSVDEDVVLFMCMAMPFETKKKLDSLILSRVARNGESGRNLSAADFDGKIMEYNKLRAQVLLWNLQGFFAFWAERKAEEKENLSQESQKMA